MLLVYYELFQATDLLESEHVQSKGRMQQTMPKRSTFIHVNYPNMSLGVKQLVFETG